MLPSSLMSTGNCPYGVGAYVYEKKIETFYSRFRLLYIEDHCYLGLRSYLSRDISSHSVRLKRNVKF